MAQFHQMLDHRRGQVFNFLRSRLALPGIHRPVFLFESLTGAFQTPFSPFDPSLSLFCAGGMKNEVDRVRAGILRNRGRDASRNEATAPESNSNRSSKPLLFLCFQISSRSPRFSIARLLANAFGLGQKKTFRKIGTTIDQRLTERAVSRVWDRRSRRSV